MNSTIEQLQADVEQLKHEVKEFGGADWCSEDFVQVDARWFWRGRRREEGIGVSMSMSMSMRQQQPQGTLGRKELKTVEIITCTHTTSSIF